MTPSQKANQQIAELVMRSEANWKAASLFTCVMAWAFGERLTFDHIGWRFCISQWRGVDYLLSIKEPREQGANL